MAATTIKTDPIQSDKVKFRTQIVDGKPQIFFDAINDSSTKTRSKRNSRSMNNPPTNRLAEQQKSKINNQKSPMQNGTTRTKQSTNKVQANEDGSSLGVYMTMDELSELVKAVKENAKTDNNTNTEAKHPPPPPAPPLPQQLNESTTAPVVPKLDLSSDHLPPPRAQISPREQALSIMADKKRQKWLREKAEIEQMQLQIEYDKLKHQLSPRHKNTSVSPERSTFQYDFPPPNKQQPPPPPPAPPVPQSYHQYDASPKVNEDPSNDVFKTRLMEKKQQQWKQENSEKMPVWNPFGRPGAGAPQLNENQTRTSQLPSHDVMPYRPPPPQQQLDNSSSSLPPTFVHSDQTRVPAAMRTNLLFGDVRFDEDVKTAKEIERRQWLDDLQKQIEDNKRQKFTQHETERRQDFLHENVQPLVQEAANRHQQQKETSSNLLRTNNTGQDMNKFNQRDSVVQQTYDKILEAGELAKYEKTSQLIEKLKRNGHQTDSLTKTLPDVKSTVPASNQRTGEKLFGPNYETSSNQNMNSKVDPLHLNAPADRKQPYRPFDARRDDAVNTVGSTFRSEHSVQSDVRMPQHRQTNPYAYEDSDLPPQAPNHHNRNPNYQQGKKSTRMRPVDDNHPPRRTSTTTYHTNIIDDGTASQLSGHRSNNNGPVDHLNRPLWNYRNSEQREYVPNSKRDPHYEKRQRLKHFEQGNYDRIDDVQKKTCYNRWNSDSELQQQRQKKQNPINRVHSTVSKTTSHGNHKDESIMNLLRGQNKQQHQQEAFGTTKPSSNQTKTDEEYHSNHTSALENYVPYTRADEALEPAKPYSPISQSRDTSPQRQGTDTYDNYQQREWNNTNRQNPSVQPGSYDAPPSRQEHILQQLSAIKENLVRRQRELASSMNAIPV